MKQFLKRFRQNRSGLAYVWGVAACTLIFFPLIYWVLSVLLDDIAAITFATYAFTGAAQSAWLLCKALISALPTIVVFIVILWGAVNAKARSFEG